MQFEDGDLPDREQFEAFIKSLPAVEIVRQWGDASVGKVGGKIFAIWGMATQLHVSFKCSDMSFQMLPELDNISPAKYLSRAKWVDVAQGSPLTCDDLGAYLREAHRLIAQKLPRKTKQQLGLIED